MVEERRQFFELHPTAHQALPRLENLSVESVPLGISSLWLPHPRRPLYGVEFLDFKDGGQVSHGPHAVEVIEGVVDAPTLLPDEGLHETSVVIFAHHGGDVALQLAHLPWRPSGEIAESHLVALAYDVVEFVEHLKIDVIDALHLSLHHLRPHHGVHQYLVGAFECRQDVKALHQVGHSHVVVAFRPLLAGPQQLLVQEVVGMLPVERNGIV